MDANTRQRHARQATIAIVLWCVLAFLVWNVVFDRVLVLAGRRFAYFASVADQSGGPTLLIDDWMRPAALAGLRLATLSAAVVLIIPFVVVPRARRRADAGPRR